MTTRKAISEVGNLTWHLPTTWHWISAKADKNLIHNLSRFLYHTKYNIKKENVICQPRSVSIGKKCALMVLSMAWGSFPLYTDWPILSFNNLVSSTNYNFIKCEFVSLHYLVENSNCQLFNYCKVWSIIPKKRYCPGACKFQCSSQGAFCNYND